MAEQNGSKGANGNQLNTANGPRIGSESPLGEGSKAPSRKTPDRPTSIRN